MKPRVFIGSSVEGKKLCGALQFALQHEARVSAWYQTFPLSTGTLDSLLGKFINCDFAIFVFSPDDLATIRATEYAIARDNVLFEAGLFMGMHGKGRAFIVTPLGAPSFHMPTDLLGFTTANYDPKHAVKDPSSALGAAQFLITQAMDAVTRAQDDIDVKAFASYKDGAHWPLKLNLKVTNTKSVSVLIESESFSYTADAPAAPNDPVLRDEGHKPAFRVGVNDKGVDIYNAACVLEPGKTIDAWVAFDPKIGEENLKRLLKEHKVGSWSYRCVWHGQHPTARTYERDF